MPAQGYVGQFLVTFKDYPQRQKVGSFNLDQVLQQLKEKQRVEVERTRRGATRSAPPSFRI